MDIQKRHLMRAADAGLLEADQIDPLWEFLATQPAEQGQFRGSHILFYLGGLIAIGAMSLFMTLGWSSFGGMGIFLIACGYAFGACLLADYLLYKKRQSIPAGLMGALAISMVPLAIYGLQEVLGYWQGSYHSDYRDFHQYIDWRWIMMEFGTLIFGILLLWRYKLPFMMMPIAVVLWYMSMDITPFLFHDSDYNWTLRAKVSIGFGLFMLIGAFITDLKTRHSLDYAWWLYLFGLLAFWGGLSSQHSGNEWAKFGYCLINLGLIAVGGMLARRVFAVFGGIGVAGYLSYLAWNLFEDSLMFPFVLSFIGLAVIWAGLIWQKREKAIHQRLQQFLPQALREMIAHRK